MIDKINLLKFLKIYLRVKLPFPTVSLFSMKEQRFSFLDGFTRKQNLRQSLYAKVLPGPQARKTIMRGNYLEEMQIQSDELLSKPWPLGNIAGWSVRWHAWEYCTSNNWQWGGQGTYSLFPIICFLLPTAFPMEHNSPALPRVLPGHYSQMLETSDIE